MAGADKTIEAASEIVGGDMKFDRLDQIFDLQRLIGPIIAYKALLEIVINSSDHKERRLAASSLLQAVDEDPDRVAERLRASMFSDLSMEELHAVVQTGIADPEEAVKKLEEAAD